MDFQLKEVQERAQEIDKHYKRTEDEIKKHEQLLKKEENQAIVADMKKRMDQAREYARDFEAVGENTVERRDMFDVAEIIVDNKLLIEEIDRLIGADPSAASETSEEELSELSQSFIDKMYNKFSKKKDPSKFQAANVLMEFGKPRVESYHQKNVKVLKKSQTRVRAADQLLQHSKALPEPLKQVKEAKKAEIKSKIDLKQQQAV